MTEFRAKVAARRPVADGIIELTIARDDGAHLPPWWPGAHVDLVLANGMTRQYSLIAPGDVEDSFTVAVLNEPEGRGGSRYIHEHLVEGAPLVVGGWRNNFRLRPATRYVFIAGGIGITALLPMVREADRAGARWMLSYAGRSRTTMSYLDEVEAYGGKAHVVPRDESDRLDVASLLSDPMEQTLVYCCGPERLIDGVEQAMAAWAPGALHVEKFTPRGADVADADALDQFEIELRRTGITLQVGDATSIVDVCDDAGITIPTSCREGTCGSCETLVVEGVPAHRDAVLNPDEAASSEVIIPCVSRSCTPRLVLDL